MKFRRYHLPAQCHCASHMKRFHYSEEPLTEPAHLLTKLNSPTSCWHYVIMDEKAILPKPRLIDRIRAWWNGWNLNK